MRQNQCSFLLIAQPAFDQRQIQILVTAIDFVPDDRMANVREMNANLVLAAGSRQDAKQRKCPRRFPGSLNPPEKCAYSKKFRL